MRQLVTSTRIDQWFTSASRDAQELLPHLVRRLILATVPIDKLKLIEIAAGDELRRRGYDGQVNSATIHPFVPEGISIWEMGTGAPADKFRKDYGKRTNTPGAVEPSSTTFVFVTPHSWEGKVSAQADANGEGTWKGVRIFDSSDLEAWLETSPPVARWLADQMNIPVHGMEDVATFARLLAAKYNGRFLPDMIIGGRTKAEEAVTAFLSSTDLTLVLDSESFEETAAFVCAAIERLPTGDRDRALASTIVVDQPAAIDYLAGTSVPITVIPTSFEANRRARVRASKYLRIIATQVRRAEAGAPETLLVHLGTVRRQSISDSLRSSGMFETQAERISRECKGSLSAALMMMSEGPDEPLEWTKPGIARALAPLVLASQWLSTSSKDQEAICKLAGISPLELNGLVCAWSGRMGPLIVRGAVQDWIGWDFAWKELSKSFDKPLLDRFVDVVREVLLETDPAIDLKPEDRWQATVLGKQRAYSHALRSGLVGSVVQFGVHNPEVQAIAGQSYSSHLVRLLLGVEGPAFAARWFSLASLIPDLAEAAPEVFLDSAEAFSKDRQAVELLFTEQDMFASSRHTYLLWALERLAWSPQFLGRTTIVLGRLAAIDPGGKLMNRPANSLREIFLPWHPSTTATVSERVSAIQALHASMPEVAWKLSLRLMPQDHDCASPTDKPRWRTCPASQTGTTIQDYWNFIKQLLEQMLSWSKGLPERVGSLVSLYDELWRGNRELADSLARSVLKEDIEGWDDAIKSSLCETTRELISKHQEYDDAEWAIPADALEPIRALHERSLPSSLPDRYAWCFGTSFKWSLRGKKSFEEEEKAIAEAQDRGLREIIDNGGLTAVNALIQKTKDGTAVGFALARIGLTDSQETDLLQNWIARDEGAAKLAGTCRSYLAVCYALKGDDWLDHLVANPKLQWNGQVLADLGSALPASPPVWDRIEKWPFGAAELYWAQAPFNFLADARQSLDRAARSLIKANRLYRAVNLIGGYSYNLGKGELPVPVDLLVNLLTEAVRHDPREETGGTDFGSLSHHVSQLLDLLETASLPRDQLASLEWKWMPALRHTPHGFRNLQLMVAEDPNSFVQLLEMAFRSEGDPPRDCFTPDLSFQFDAFGGGLGLTRGNREVYFTYYQPPPTRRGVRHIHIHVRDPQPPVWPSARVCPAGLHLPAFAHAPLSGHRPLAPARGRGRFGTRTTTVCGPGSYRPGTDHLLLPLGHPGPLPPVDRDIKASVGRPPLGQGARWVRLPGPGSFPLLRVFGQYASGLPLWVCHQPVFGNSAFPGPWHRPGNGHSVSGALCRLPRCAGEVLLQDQSSGRQHRGEIRGMTMYNGNDHGGSSSKPQPDPKPQPASGSQSSPEPSTGGKEQKK